MTFVSGCDSGDADFEPAGPAALAGIALSPAGDPTLVVPMGELQFTATGTYTDGTSADLTGSVTWTSSDATVGVISNDAGTLGLATLSAAGATEITALHAASGVSATVAVSVLAGPLLSLEISPLDPSVLVGTTLQLAAAAAVDADGTMVDRTGAVAWTSSDESVATVSAGGLVSALALGTTTITAVDPVSGEQATTSVTVTDVLGLSYVGLSRGSVVGGSSVQVTGTVVLTSIASEPIEVTLWTTNDAVVSVPVSVVVPKGAARASFAVATSPVTQKTRVFVWGSDGVVEKRASLNVRKQR